jgi:predicted Zn finger-like uncharacterized protein
MKVSCQACGAKYTIADDKVRGRKVKIRCKSCGTPMVVDGQSESPAGAAAAPAGAPADAPGEAASAVGSVSWSVNLSDTDQRTMTTEEIVAGWQSGVVTSDAFVWKDGMGDWVAVLEHPDLKGLLAAATNAPGGPTPFGPTIVTAPAESARLASAPRGAGVDLFDAAGGSTEEEDVATSAPALPQAGSTAYDDGKMTGARNENSVLFSLDALKGGLTAEPKKTNAAAPARKAPSSSAAASAASSDPFAMSPSEMGGANPLFSLNTNQALLTAPAPPEPPPARLDATGTPVAQPMNKMVVYGGGAAAAVILLLLGLLLGRSGTQEGPAPEGSAKEQAAATTGTESEKKPDTKPEEKPAEKPAETSAPTASAAPSAAPVSTGSKPTAVGGGKPSTGTGTGSGTTATKPTATSKPEEMPSTGSAPFSVSAAQVALTQAAGNAASCAKPAGPTGSGKVQVTFATSGRVTTANVAGPPFAGTPVGGCVAGVFRKARIPAFSGNPVTVSKSFSIR